jgi:hypothetical protein
MLRGLIFFQIPMRDDSFFVKINMEHGRCSFFSLEMAPGGK